MWERRTKGGRLSAHGGRNEYWRYFCALVPPHVKGCNACDAVRASAFVIGSVCRATLAAS